MKRGRQILVYLFSDRYKRRYSKKFLEKIFYNDLCAAIASFKKKYNSKRLPDFVQEIVIEMIFQLGIKKTLKFQKFNKYIKKELYYLAAFEMMKSQWYRQTPNRVNKLINIIITNNDSQKRK